MSTALQQPRFFAPGDKLGKYELIRQVAVGGMAEIYLARTTGLEGFEKLVVVKRILPQYAANQSFITMFLNEARLAATLHHPNIAQVFDIGHDGADYFFSMEYIHGEDLGRLVATASDAGVGLSLDVALTLIVGLCAGLHYAHEKVGADGKPLRVVHRDVSPSNVLVSYDGAVKLVDFGIARAGNKPPTSKGGGLKGKIAYMSPEQCRGLQTLDRRSDLFSVGAILYELTTGRQPFTDETEYGVLNQIVTRDVDPPSRFVPSYPPALEAIVMRAMARDPEQRYRTAQELQGQLEDFAHENRLRLSPLVLARLMGTLFPARLEEWDHAKAQGAFFVEQHVVRTLIESGKTSDSSPAYQSPLRPPTGMEDTSIGPPLAVVGGPGDEAPTQVRLSQAPNRMTPLPMHMPPAQGDYVADVTELVRPSRAPRALSIRPDLSAPSRSRLPLIAGCVGVIGMAIGLGIAMGSKDKPAEKTPERGIGAVLEQRSPDLAGRPSLLPAVPAPAAAVEPSAPVGSDPAPAVVAAPEEPVVAAPEEPVVDEPAVPAPRAVAKRPKPVAAKRPKPVVVKRPAPKPAAPPEEEVEAPAKPGKWSADSPFMPVRPVKKK